MTASANPGFQWRPSCPRIPLRSMRARDAMRSRRRRRLGDLARLEHVGRVAELAGHRDLTVLDHVVAIVLREAAQHPLDPRPRARALRVQVPAAEHAYPALVEQPVEELLRRDLWIEQLDVLDG